MRTDRLSTRAVALAPFAIALVVGLASCGGGGSSKTVAAAATTTTVAGPGGANRAALQAFTTCMTQHGITVPTFAPRPRPSTTLGSSPTTADNGPGGGGGGGFGGFGGGRGVGNIISSTDPATKAAVAACQGTLPAGFLQQIQKGQTALNAYRSCMQSHGVTVTGGFRGPGGSTTTTTPAFTAANDICKALLPARGQGGPGGPGTGSTPPTSVAQ